MLGVTTRTIRRWTAQGHLRCLRINRTTRYCAADLAALIGRNQKALTTREPDSVR
jgi:DNA-binding transcriptional MerR regulator